MLSRFVALTIVATLLYPALAPAATESEDPTAILFNDFITAFNAREFETMAAFYEQGATSAFNDRRTEQEDRALHQQLVSMLGTLTFEKIEHQGAEGTRLIVEASVPASQVEFRFRLAGEPPLIDGFRVGVDPGDGMDHDSGEEEPETDFSLQDDNMRHGPFGFLASREGIYQSQVVVQADGSLLLLWVQRGHDGLDLFAARKEQGGEFSQPVKINHRSLNGFTGDEARPSVAVDRDGMVAVAWTAKNNDIVLAVGSQYGRKFEPPVKLNQDQKQAFRTMPSVALSPDGVAHTVWLDPRSAPAGHEEPSDLFYAVVKDGAVSEANLTAKQEPTVCGCCRPYIAIDEAGDFDIVFRNANEAGYRDISYIGGTADALSEPQPTSPPIWKLGGCPSAGPVLSHGGTMWKDASTGDWRMLWATDANLDPEVLFPDRENLELTHPPRAVSGQEDWLLVGARPHSLIATRVDGAWKVLRDDLPPWATSAAVIDDQLILVGNRKGILLASTNSL
jgi:hypothetical protein